MTDRDSALLKVADLRVAYGRVRALKGISLEVSRGEIVTVLGANGAGKSTMMKAIAGLVPAIGGGIEFAQRPIERLGAHRRAGTGIALVPEGRMVFTPLTVRENLRLGMLSDSWFGGRRTFEERVAKVLDLFPALGSRMDAPAGDLSGGQQQMLAVGRALMSEPQLLLLDEPSLGLAPQVIESLFRTLLALNEEHDVTILLAEQNIDNALAIADRGYVLEVGEIALTDSAEALLDRGDVEDVYLGRRVQYADLPTD
jgi:branched-chain amino acid transport system ATP-binding protein